MKKWIYIWVVLVGCDQLKVTEDNLKNYPEIQPFILGHKEFEGSHDIDLGSLWFSYKLNKPYTAPFVTLDSIAARHNWIIKSPADDERIYIKKIKSYPANNEADTLHLKFNSKSDQLIFENY
ncbi:hypothetical protein [Pedobacter ginsengisoli]|uniref:hypothetical protein n=1 Tax=Pedobacter ginsengisoli TaxID=363852 RepID=UPI00254DB8F0|nr:hypothetical protein [Pedobacter ginsengisoli]